MFKNKKFFGLVLMLSLFAFSFESFADTLVYNRDGRGSLETYCGG